MGNASGLAPGQPQSGHRSQGVQLYPQRRGGLLHNQKRSRTHRDEGAQASQGRNVGPLDPEQRRRSKPRGHATAACRRCRVPRRHRRPRPLEFLPTAPRDRSVTQVQPASYLH